jgi:hypothetical protein
VQSRNGSAFSTMLTSVRRPSILICGVPIQDASWVKNTKSQARTGNVMQVEKFVPIVQSDSKRVHKNRNGIHI